MLPPARSHWSAPADGAAGPCADTALRSRGVTCPRFAGHFPSLQTEGAGNTGCTLHPRSRVQSENSKGTRAYRFSGGNPAFPAQWFYGLFISCSPRRGRLICLRRRQSCLRRLDAGTEASGPHDFAVRVGNARQARRRVHRTPLRVRDVAQRPSVWRGMANHLA
jgi:hypothetical protein